MEERLPAQAKAAKCWPGYTKSGRSRPRSCSRVGGHGETFFGSVELWDEAALLSQEEEERLEVQFTAKMMLLHMLTGERPAS